MAVGVVDADLAVVGRGRYNAEVRRILDGGDKGLRARHTPDELSGRDVEESGAEVGASDDDAASVGVQRDGEDVVFAGSVNRFDKLARSGIPDADDAAGVAGREAAVVAAERHRADEYVVLQLGDFLEVGGVKYRLAVGAGCGEAAVSGHNELAAVGVVRILHNYLAGIEIEYVDVLRGAPALRGMRSAEEQQILAVRRNRAFRAGGVAAFDYSRVAEIAVFKNEYPSGVDAAAVVAALFDDDVFAAVGRNGSAPRAVGVVDRAGQVEGAGGYVIYHYFAALAGDERLVAGAVGDHHVLDLAGVIVESEVLVRFDGGVGLGSRLFCLFIVVDVVDVVEALIGSVVGKIADPVLLLFGGVYGGVEYHIHRVGEEGILLLIDVYRHYEEEDIVPEPADAVGVPFDDVAVIVFSEDVVGEHLSGRIAALSVADAGVRHAVDGGYRRTVAGIVAAFAVADHFDDVELAAGGPAHRGSTHHPARRPDVVAFGQARADLHPAVSEQVVAD